MWCLFIFIVLIMLSEWTYCFCISRSSNWWCLFSLNSLVWWCYSWSGLLFLGYNKLILFLLLIILIFHLNTLLFYCLVIVIYILIYLIWTGMGRCLLLIELLVLFLFVLLMLIGVINLLSLDMVLLIIFILILLIRLLNLFRWVISLYQKLLTRLLFLMGNVRLKLLLLRVLI